MFVYIIPGEYFSRPCWLHSLLIVQAEEPYSRNATLTRICINELRDDHLYVVKLTILPFK